MPEFKSLLMLLVVTVVGAGATLYINKKHKDTVDVVIVSTTDKTSPVATTTNNILGTPTKPSINKPSATSSLEKPAGTSTLPQGIVPSLTGTLTAVDTGCFSDGVCFATVAGKKVVLLIGRYQGKLGKIIGADSIGDLEAHIGEQATVFAGTDESGNFTLLGNEMFYLKVSSSTKPVAAGSCVVGGCSAQVCGEASEMEDMVTTCEYREQYACYKQTKCERQTTGKCGWTENAELAMCLKKSS